MIADSAYCTVAEYKHKHHAANREKPRPTPDQLRAIVGYDPDTGQFWWKQHRDPDKVGIDPTNTDRKGYRRIYINGRSFGAHVLGFVIYYGLWPIDEIDHVDRVPGNNRIDNLRPATRQQQVANRGCWSKAGFRGVSQREKNGRPT